MKTPPDFRKHLETLSRTRQTYEVFAAFVKLAACALSAGTREAEYLEEAKRWSGEELSEFSRALGALTLEMESRPYEDILGGYYMECAISRKGQQWNGEFHTPKCVCDMLARMTISESTLPAEGPITVAEPACGAGAMILAMAQALPPAERKRIRVVATDVNRVACDMCFINTTLWSIPCHVIHGNTLTLESWGQWKNLFYIMPWLGPGAFQNDHAQAESQPQPLPAIVVPAWQETPSNHEQLALAIA